MWSLVNFEHLEESSSHDETELWSSTQKMEQIKELYGPYLPATKWKILSNSLWLWDAGLSVYDGICSIGYIRVDESACDIYHEYNFFEFVVGCGFE